MGANSNHYGDISTWIEKVIESCETILQTRTADKLLKNFEDTLIRQYPADYWPNYFYDFIRPLKLQLDDKRDELLKTQLT
jgi:hypothetical protein